MPEILADFTLTNQRRRGLRNRRNSQPPNYTNQRSRIAFVPKTKYDQSTFTADGVLVVSKRKRAPPTAAEKEAKRQKKLQIKEKKVSLLALRHKIINIFQHGMFTGTHQFPAGKRPAIVSWLQETYEQYRDKAAAKSLVHRVITRFKKKDEMPHLDPFRDCRGENRRSPKRKNVAIIELCDEFLSEPGMTAPKAVQRLAERNFVVSRQTAHRIAKDICFRWTKPWYTDVLTPAQKLKSKIFCRDLLRLTPAQLLNRLGEWMWTDEKWWDVGPGKSRYIKVLSKFEAKLLAQVKKKCLHVCCLSA